MNDDRVGASFLFPREGVEAAGEPAEAGELAAAQPREAGRPSGAEEARRERGRLCRAWRVRRAFAAAEQLGRQLPTELTLDRLELLRRQL
jgi:hypothetical protein